MSLFFFFFFKQKTAYEIKECDWSSDVCSSDLATPGFPKVCRPAEDSIHNFRPRQSYKPVHHQLAAALPECDANSPGQACTTPASPGPAERDRPRRDKPCLARCPVRTPHGGPPRAAQPRYDLCCELRTVPFAAETAHRGPRQQCYAFPARLKGQQGPLHFALVSRDTFRTLQPGWSLPWHLPRRCRGTVLALFRSTI